MLIKLFLIFLSVSFIAVSYGIPRRNNDEENSETETVLPIATESPYERTQTESPFEEETQTESNSDWHGVWEKAKSLIDRVRGHTGEESDSSGSISQKIGVANMFYKMLKENPQQLQEYLKQVVANKINERINQQDTTELQQQSMDVQKQLQTASAKINKGRNSTRSDNRGQ